MRAFFLLLVALLPLPLLSGAPAPLVTVKLWPGTPPGDEALALPPEGDLTKPSDALIAGRRIIKLGNVSTPLVEVHPAPRDKANGAAVVICPGGGFNILAWDLEGTEVSAWLNSLGVTGIVLKYRVPARAHASARWLPPVQDAQRALRLARANAAAWNIDPQRLGILGFSAGGAAAGLTALKHAERLYPRIDAADDLSARPDFALLVYPAYFFDPKTNRLLEEIVVPADAPPTFFVHAWDDRVPVQNSLLLAAAMREKKVPAAVHVYPSGGHGYGLRRTSEPVTTWPDRAEAWLRHAGFLAVRPARTP